MEFAEDEGRDSTTGVCETFLRVNAMVDMLENMPRFERQREREYVCVWSRRIVVDIR